MFVHDANVDRAAKFSGSFSTSDQFKAYVKPSSKKD
jgi:hypothetical protein